jgi:hypothetical protein
MCGTRKEVYMGLTGGNLSEERFPPSPLPKTFNPNFSKQDALHETNALCIAYRGRPFLKNLSWKF